MLPSSLRDDFPFLRQIHPNGNPWVYLDSAATTLKPLPVIQAITAAMSLHSTNVHRSVHGLGDVTTEKYETARRKVARFIGAETHEIVFVRNTTEALNLVAQGYDRKGVTLASWGEHHSNLLPWQRGGLRGVAPLDNGSPNLPRMMEELKKGDVSIVTVSHISNVTGIKTEIRELADAAHRAGAILVVDAAQSVGRIPIDVQELDCDFLAFSGHKMYGPSGIGVLYGKAEKLLELRASLLGGGTVESVTVNGQVARPLPWKLEAGTPAIEATIALGAAVDYLQQWGMDEVAEHESALAQYAASQFKQLNPRLQSSWHSEGSSVGSFSFYLQNESSHVMARTLSDRYGICVRSGYLCAQPLLEHWKVPPVIRLSFGIYNRTEDIDYCFHAIQEILRSLAVK